MVGVVDIILVEISAIVDLRRLKMQNFNEKHPHVIENVGCRCKICEESILKYQKGQDVDAIVHDRQAEKHLQVQRKASCRCVGPQKEHLQQ